MPRKTKPRSELVSVLGTGFELVKALSDEVQSLGGSDDDLRRILSEKPLAKEIAELLVRQPTGDSFPLTIDYTKSLAELVAAGGYDYANPNITEENFPVGSSEAEVESVLVHLDRLATSEEVLDELERKGLRAATMVELLAFGDKHPDRQREFPIIALGSVWADPRGGRRVGCLWGGADGRRLGLCWFGGQWDGDYRFLAVRK